MDLVVFMSAVDAVDGPEIIGEVLVDVPHGERGKKDLGLLAVTFEGDDTVGLGERAFFYLVKLREYHMN
jgi:hypothetical protein